MQGGCSVERTLCITLYADLFVKRYHELLEGRHVASSSPSHHIRVMCGRVIQSSAPTRYGIVTGFHACPAWARPLIDKRLMYEIVKERLVMRCLEKRHLQHQDRY